LKKISCFTIIVILLLNAGITIALINHYDESQSEVKDMFSSSKTQANKSVDTSRRNAITNAVRDVEPAVVSVNVIKTELVRGRSPFGFGFFDFFDNTPMQRQVQSIGSGVIYDSEGYLIPMRTWLAVPPR